MDTFNTYWEKYLDSELATIMNEFETNSSFPPYNLIRLDENKFIIEMAVAGYKKDDITIKTSEDKLYISVEKKSGEVTQKPKDYLVIHKGLTERKFDKVFSISKGYNIQIKDAKLEDGILKINIESYPKDVKKLKEYKL